MMKKFIVDDIIPLQCAVQFSVTIDEFVADVVANELSCDEHYVEAVYRVFSNDFNSDAIEFRQFLRKYCKQAYQVDLSADASFRLFRNIDSSEEDITNEVESRSLDDLLKGENMVEFTVSNAKPIHLSFDFGQLGDDLRGD
jgi:hypothetical protein